MTEQEHIGSVAMGSLDKENFNRIWLEPRKGYDPYVGRQWCQDNQWGDDGIEYVRADLVTHGTSATDPAPQVQLKGQPDTGHGERRTLGVLQGAQTGAQSIQAVDHVVHLLHLKAIHTDPIDPHWLARGDIDHRPIPVLRVSLDGVPKRVHEVILARSRNVWNKYLSDPIGIAARAWPRSPPSDVEPVAWLRHGEKVPIQGCPFGAMWITNKDDPRGFPVYAEPPASIVAPSRQDALHPCSKTKPSPSVIHQVVVIGFLLVVRPRVGRIVALRLSPRKWRDGTERFGTGINWKRHGESSCFRRSNAIPFGRFPCLAQIFSTQIAADTRKIERPAPAPSGGPAYLDFITPDEIFDKGPAAVKKWQEAKVSELQPRGPSLQNRRAE